MKTAPMRLNPKKETNGIANLIDIINRLTLPHPSISEPEMRRRIHLLSTILLILIFTGIAAVLVNLSQKGLVSNNYIGLSAVIILGLAYGLSRTKYYVIAAAISMIVSLFSVFYAALISHNPEYLFFIILGVLLSSMYLSPGATIIATGVIMAAMLVLPVVVSDFQNSNLIIQAILIGMTGLLATGYAFILQQDIQLIEQQSQDLSKDMTKLKQSQEDLQKSEFRLANILENVAEAIIVADERQNIILFNKAAEEILGYQQEEVLGQPLDVVLPRTFIEMHNQLLNSVGNTAKEGNNYSRHSEILGCRKGGIEFPAELNYSAILENGKLIYTAVLIDITARKLAEEKLQKSEARLQLQVDRMPIACIVWDTDFQIVSWNPAAEKIFGFNKREVLGQKPYQLIVPADLKDQVDNVWSRLMKGDTTANSINENLTKSGHRILCEWSNTPLQEANGNIFGVLSMVQDVTERREAELALKASEARYHSLFNRIPVGLYRTSFDGEILDANPALVELLGYPNREMLLKDNAIDIFVHPEDRDKEIALIAKDGVLHGFKMPLRRRDGCLIWVRDTVRIINDSDGNTSYEGSLEDITEQVNNEELIYKIASRNQVLADISHAIVGAGLDDQAILDAVTNYGANWIGGSCFVLSLQEEEPHFRIDSISHQNHNGATRLREIMSLIFNQHIDTNSNIFKSELTQPITIREITQEQIRSALDTEDWQYLNQCSLFDIQYALLRAQDRIIGILGISFNHFEHLIEGDDRVFLQEIADRTALAVANAQLFGTVQSHLNRLEALKQIDIAIKGTVDLRVSLGTILDQALVQIGVDAANVLVLNPHTLTLDFIVGRGFQTKALQNTHLRLGEGYAGRAALDQKIINIPDLRKRGTDLLRSPSFHTEAFISYFAVPLIAMGQVKGVLEVFHRRPVKPDPEWLDFLEALAGQAAIAIDSASLFNELQRSNQELIIAYDATIEGWSRALDLKDKETEGHTRRVTNITLRLARSMGVNENELAFIRRGALLHDIGKMAIPDSILLKPGPLTKDEWEIMRKHPTYAYEMLYPINYLRAAIDIPYSHHEKWDGTGYPRGLKGEQIPLSARIFAIVDVWDALCSDRPYRSAWPVEKALVYIKEQSGTHFDPNVVNEFLKVVDSGERNPSQ